MGDNGLACDTHAAFALEAAPGVYFGGSLTEYETKPPSVGMHGYDPGARR